MLPMGNTEDNQEGLQELVRRLENPDRPTRECGLAEKYSNQGKITTLMLRNVPSKYTQDLLLEELIDCMGSSDSFDFFYLPWDQQNDCNIGFAFVNFRTVQAAERCTRIFTNFSFRRFDSPKICKVYPAHIQGLENNVLHLMDRAVSEARSHYPIIMWKGEKLKLGKVIAAIDMHRRVLPPASAPGQLSGSREPPLGVSSALGGGMHMEGMDQPWPGGDAEDYFGDGVEGGGGQGSTLEAVLGAYLPREGGKGRMSAPRSNMEGGSSRQGRLPPGLVHGLRDHASREAEVVEAMPGLRAALWTRRQSGEQSAYAVPASMPGGLRPPHAGGGAGGVAGVAGGLSASPASGPWPPGPVNTGDVAASPMSQPAPSRLPLCHEVCPPSVGIGGAMPPPTGLPLPPGGVQQPPSLRGTSGSLSQQSLGPQGLMPPGSRGVQGGLQGAVQPGPQPGYPSPTNQTHSQGQPPMGMQQAPPSRQGMAANQTGGGGIFEAVSARSPTAQQGQGLVQRPIELGAGPAGAGGDPSGPRTIELRDPNDDVLGKFLGRFGS